MDKKEYLREYRLKNKEKIKEYYQNSKDKIKAYNQTEEGYKKRKILKWKERGVITNDFNILYDLYINTTECNICNKVFMDKFDRCLDHDHENGLFRYVLCRYCNTKDNWKNKV